MKKIKSYNNFTNETLITEFVDPITLAFAIAGVGIAFGPQLMKAYRSRKISKANMKDLKKMLSKAKAEVKKYERQGLDHDAAEAQSEVDHIEARIEDLSREMDSDETIIRNFEKDKKTQKDLEQELKNVDPEILKRALKSAKKEASKLK
jgi:predicted RNase H-like nuclease (RuvC/YqgF family)